jgi:glycine C-acetyltransferase
LIEQKLSKMYTTLKSDLQKKLEDLKSKGLFKEERIITSQQEAEISVLSTGKVLIILAWPIIQR